MKLNKRELRKVKQAIETQGLKIKDLAKEIGLHPNTLSSAINGNRALGESARILLFQKLNLSSEALSQRVSA
jgi:plasmid maintenance system antidote protein VapI